MIGRLLIYFSLISLLNCVGQIKTEEKIRINNEFDMSYDDKKILFACYLPNEGVSIFEQEVEGGIPRLIIKSSDGNNYYCPKYSPDGKKIVFIKSKKKEKTFDESVCIADSNGNNVLQLTDGNEIINGVSFSKYYENEILYIKAAKIEKYSPIGIAQPHYMNFYSLNYKTKQTKKISTLNSYNISKYSEVDSNLIVMGMMGGDDGGIFFFKRDNPDTTYRFIPKNNPRGEPNMYYTPYYSKLSNVIAFTAPYELYIMSVDNLEATLLFSYTKNHIDDFCFFNTKKRILFLLGGDTNFKAIDIDRKNLETIKIDFQSIRSLIEK